MQCKLEVAEWHKLGIETAGKPQKAESHIFALIAGGSADSSCGLSNRPRDPMASNARHDDRLINILKTVVQVHTLPPADKLNGTTASRSE